MRNAILAGAAALALALPGAAWAHVVLTKPDAPANSYAATALRVGHGCSGSATVSLKVDIPDQVQQARPQPKPGWTLEIARRPGAAADAEAASITWRGRLPSDQFDEFGLFLKLGPRPGPLVFPVTQSCENGEQRWTPVLTVVAPEGGGEAHMHHGP